MSKNRTRHEQFRPRGVRDRLWHDELAARGAANAREVAPPIALDPGARDPTILRSVLYFPSAERCIYGAQALAEYGASAGQGRLIRSIKKHLPSRSFVGTNIDARPMNLEDLIGAFLADELISPDHFFTNASASIFCSGSRRNR